LQEKGLDVTAETLHEAFDNLKESKLDLFAESKLEAPKAKGKPEEHETFASLAQQQAARKNTPIAGVASTGNRDSFINAAQETQPEPIKITGRVHL